MQKEKLHPERRRWPRADFSATAHIFSENVPRGIYGVKNLSAGGALLFGDPSLAPGASVRVLLELPRRRPIALTARVLRKQTVAGGTPAFAVAFRNVNPRTEDAIHNAVLARLEEIRESATLSTLATNEHRGRGLPTYDL